MAYTVQLAISAARQLRVLPRVVQERLRRAIDRSENEPRPRGVVKLRGETDTYRFRVSDYRVIYEFHDDVLVVLVLRVAHRRKAYRR